MRDGGGVSGLKVTGLCSELQASLDYLTSSCSKNNQTKPTNQSNNITNDQLGESEGLLGSLIGAWVSQRQFGITKTLSQYV